MAISVLRLPLLSRLSASARFRKDGAVVITPNDARAMLPDLIKNLLFMILTSNDLVRFWTLVFVLCSLPSLSKAPGSLQHEPQLLSTKQQVRLTASEILATPESIQQSLRPDSKSLPDYYSPLALPL